MEQITKDDLRQFGLQLVHEVEKMLDEKMTAKESSPQKEWLRSKEVRALLNISPATLQNIRITGKIRYKKILGSYYYSLVDLKNLGNENQHR